MILYKYYSFRAGMQALASRQLGFRKPTEFNDPFELSAFSATEGYDLSDGSDGRRGIRFKVDSIASEVVICSLSRSPLNPLMWSHYADDHRGLVIGYDAEVPLLSCRDTTLINVHDGAVFYSHAKDSRAWTKKDHDDFHEVFLAAKGLGVSEDTVKRLMRRLLLNKSIHWAYEEEVRVVKFLDHWASTVEEFFNVPENRYLPVKKIKGLYLYEVQVPIVSVYLGCRTLQGPLPPRHRKLLATVPQLFEVCMERASWDLEAIDMSDNRKKTLNIPVALPARKRRAKKA